MYTQQIDVFFFFRDYVPQTGKYALFVFVSFSSSPHYKYARDGERDLNR